MKPILIATALALGLAACSPSSGDRSTQGPNATDAVAPVPTPAPSPAASAAAADILTLDGLGALRIGEAVPADSGWAQRGAQEPNGCTTVTAPDHPRVYAIVEQGKVRRITVGKRSDVTLIEGIGIGASEEQVTAAFPGFRATPHKYEGPPAKYLTAPNGDSGDPALRFEIGADGEVSAIHVGTAPVLFYVEGCG